jgi:hypothetical protein
LDRKEHFYFSDCGFEARMRSLTMKRDGEIPACAGMTVGDVTPADAGVSCNLSARIKKYREEARMRSITMKRDGEIPACAGMTFGVGMKMWTSVITVLFWLVLGFGSVSAQHSLVPANHQVYDWLLHQRIAGNVVHYDHESIPLTRGQITTHLKEIKKNSEENKLFWRLSVSDRHLLNSYLLEFDHERIGENELYKVVLDSTETYKERAISVWKERPNPHAFTFVDTTQRVNATLTFRYGWSELNAWEEIPKDYKWGRSNFKGMQAFGTFNDFLGVHFEVDNIFVNGDWQLLTYMPQYAYAFTVQQQRKQVSQSYENSASIYSGVLGLDISSGAIQMGPGMTDPLIFSRNAPNFNWLRFTARLGWATYTAVHGSLYARTRNERIIVGTDTALTRFAPNRWVVAHRLTIRPWHWFELALFEQLTYSNRNADYAYLNPVNPVFFSELDNGDRDNAVMGADLIVRPLRGTEFYASVFIDDLVSFGSILKDEPLVDDDVAVNFGIYQTLPHALRFGASYTRIEPFVYTHWQRLNTFEQRGMPFGHRLGPNADELAFQIKKFLPYRAWGMAQIAFVRKGLNIEGAQNNAQENAGGDLLLGNAGIGKRMFQDADLHAWTDITLESQIEPIRGVIFSARVLKRVVTRGDRVGGFTFTEARVSLGF